MTFAAPAALFGLLVVPGVVAAYVWARRRRERRTAALQAQGLVTNEARRSLKARERLPFALFVAALALLVIACARPMAAVITPQRTATVVIAIDVSNSMAAKDATPSRIAVAKALAKTFVREQPSGVRIGVVAFGETAVIVQPPTTDHPDALRAIGGLSVGGGTSLGAGILTALNAIAGKTLHYNAAALANDDSGEIDLGYYGAATILLISDGEDTSQTDPVLAARLASMAGVRIQTVGVGTVAGTTVQIGGFSEATAVDPATLESVAKLSNGSYHQVDDTATLRAISKSIGLHFKFVIEHTEIGALFAAAGALLLAVGAAISVLWFGRVL